MTRVLWGTSDPLVPPRPFTPIVDVADRVGGDLRRALDAGDRDAVLGAFLALLRRPDALPTVVVLDDLHWADEATLDLLRVVGRRLNRMPTLVVGTYRDHDVDREDALRIALGEIPASSMLEIRLPPLSTAAVRELAAGRAEASALHAATDVRAAARRQAATRHFAATPRGAPAPPHGGTSPTSSAWHRPVPVVHGALRRHAGDCGECSPGSPSAPG